MRKFFERYFNIKKVRRILKRKKLLSLAFLGFGIANPFQTAKAIDYTALSRLLGRNAEFHFYIEMPLRQALTVVENNNLAAPSPNDASNWTGCQVGKGILSGTARDISACAASAYYGRAVDIEEMATLSYRDAYKIIESIWDGIQASEIPNQDIANLVMHIQMHYGNLRIVQKALQAMGANLKINGRMDKATLEALVEHAFWTPTRTFNEIRNSLKTAYQKSPYRKAFLKALNREFPVKQDYMASVLTNIRQWQRKFNCRFNAFASLFYPNVTPCVAMR